MIDVLHVEQRLVVGDVETVVSVRFEITPSRHAARDLEQLESLVGVARQLLRAAHEEAGGRDTAPK